MSSRYDMGSSTPTTTVTNTTTGPSTTQTTTQQQQVQNQSVNTQANRNYGSTVTNMDPSSLAALQGLIAQLLGGGTQNQAQDRAKRMQEVSAVQNLRNAYSKNAAFADAQGAMNQILRQAMEQAMPSLVRAAEGSGTSANSMRALLTQDALTRASEAAAARGLQAATDYGTVGANYSSVLERLTQPNNSVEEALLNALNIAKGAVTQTTGYDNTNTRQTGQTVTNTTGNQIQLNSGGSQQQTQQQFATPNAGAGNPAPATQPFQNMTAAQWQALARAASGGGVPTSNWFENYRF